jgi:hypothetical protein
MKIKESAIIQRSVKSTVSNFEKLQGLAADLEHLLEVRKCFDWLGNTDRILDYDFFYSTNLKEIKSLISAINEVKL